MYGVNAYMRRSSLSFSVSRLVDLNNIGAFDIHGTAQIVIDIACGLDITFCFIRLDLIEATIRKINRIEWVPLFNTGPLSHFKSSRPLSLSYRIVTYPKIDLVIIK